MGWFSRLIGRSPNNYEADVDVSGNLKTTLPGTASQAGFAGVAGRVDDGVVTGTPRVNRVYATEGGRLAVAQPRILWDDTFNMTAQNTAKYRAPVTGQTVGFAGGYVSLNNGAAITINQDSALQTYKVFPLFGRQETRVNFALMFNAGQGPVANGTTEIGLFSATMPGQAAPTDGVFFRWNAAAELRGVINYNGTETQTAAMTAVSLGVNHDYQIVVQTDRVLFYIDEVLRAAIILSVDAPAQGQAFQMGTQPMTMRHRIGGSAPATPCKPQISDVFVIVLGPDTGQTWPETKASMGHMGSQGQNGGTMGTTAQLANSTNPGAAVPTNTTAALGSGLGGKFHETLTLAAGTDGIIQSYQNPVGSLTQTPRNLVIRGVTISGVVTVAITTNPLTYTMSLAYGHTAVSMATAESATAKAPRRVALLATGFTTAAGVIGFQVPGTPYRTTFEAPIVIAPGEFVAIVGNKGTTTPAAGAIMWTINFDAYWE